MSDHATRQKYPRTPHLPWSPGATDDDVWQYDVNAFFEGKEVVITEKMDGENTTMYRDHIHARSIDSKHHPSRSWVKRLHQNVGHLIPEGWRVCGENLYAKHSMPYEELESYFMLFSIWDENNRALSWDETLEWAQLLELHTVPVLWRGVWDESKVVGITVDTERSEGYVVRTAEGFLYKHFSKHVAKWVRMNHVTSSTHWMHQEVVPNRLKARQESDEG